MTIENDGTVCNNDVVSLSQTIHVQPICTVEFKIASGYTKKLNVTLNLQSQTWHELINMIMDGSDI